MEQFPHDPQVAYEAAMRQGLSTDQRRAWLDAFKQAAPDNTLANYLSAREFIQAGQVDQAVQELITAAGKPQFQDYTIERAQDDVEAYLSAGYSAAEAERIALSWLELPQLAPIKQLGHDLVALAKAYDQSADHDSAQAALQIALQMGQRYSDVPNAALISQMVGLAVERLALETMDPNSPCRPNGQTAQNRLAEIAQQKALVQDLDRRSEPLMPRLSDQDVLNFENRRLRFGEVAAMQWVLSRHEQK
jgi:tetratricopeptide (TPR) repeat protein